MPRFRLPIIVVVFLITSCSSHAAPQPSGAGVNTYPQVNQTHRGIGVWVALPAPPAPAIDRSITAGFSNDMWAVEASPQNAIVEIGVDGALTVYQLPTPNAAPAKISKGPNGNMWFSESISGKLGEIALPSGVITEFSLPNPSERPCAVTAGSDGNLWFTESNNAIVGKITTTGLVTEYPLSQIQSSCAIASGPDGNVWFAGARYLSPDYFGYVGRVTPAGVVTEFAVPTSEQVPNGITVGPDSNLWVISSSPTQSTGPKIIKVHVNGQMSEFDGRHKSSSIAAGDGIVLVNWPSVRELGFVYIRTGRTGRFGYPFDATVGDLAYGTDGNFWATGTKAGQPVTLVYVRLLMKVLPASIRLNIGQNQAITVTEVHYAGTWTATSSNTAVATVTNGQSKQTFVVTSVGSGTCTITVSDNKDNWFDVPVNVN
jgi:hypothetical protein